MKNSPIRAIAIHLPQFHPFSENDAWWGKGFTEWTNVTKAKPLFEGHYQPHLPADLGFYDLRLQQALEEQAALAREYGIYGFCFYHYWFNGKRLMNTPLDNMLKAGTPDFPYMLCWANENWTRRWDGLEQEVLIRQDYSSADDEEHMRFLCAHFFKDPRYIRVNGHPFFVVYRPGLFPDMKKTTEVWRTIAKDSGVGELHLGYMQNFGLKKDPKEMGFDCAIEFHPDFHTMASPLPMPLKEKILHKLGLRRSVFFDNTILSYPQYIQKAMAEEIKADVIPGITPMWDNTARRKKGAYIFRDASPELYGKWLKHIVERFKKSTAENQFLFINAWNEWAEGNHLEPCQKYGKKYLEVTRAILNGRAYVNEDANINI